MAQLKVAFGAPEAPRGARPTALQPEVGTLPAPLNAKPPQGGGIRYHSDLMHACGENKTLTARFTMKSFRSGIRWLLGGHEASVHASLVVGMHSRPAGFSACPANFQPALVRVARRDRPPATPSPWGRAVSSFRKPFIAGTALLSLALAACGGGGGSSSTSNDNTPPPPPAKYTIGGTVSGLSGGSLVLQDNGGDNLTVSANGTFTFATSVSAGGAYAVTVLTQPTGQTCTVSNGTGTANANVTNVAVACTAVAPAKFTIGGAVSGLTGTGLVLKDNGGDNLTVSGNGPFTFATPVNSGAAYAVTVATQPSAQTCTVTNGSGTATANVTNVAVACSAVASTYTIGGTVSGLAGTGLVLQDNGGDNLTVSANGAFTFATPVAAGGAYAVTVATQPTGPAQRCIITAGTGNAAANVNTVTVKCLTTGKFAYTANYSDGTINGWTINPTNGQLSVISGTPLVDGTNPAAVSLSPNGKFAFSAANSGQKIYAFTIDQSTGVLKAVAGSPFSNPAFVQGHPYPDIAVDPQSKFLYLASFYDYAVVGFAIDQTTGALTAIPGGPFPAGVGAGAIPAFSPDGKFLYVMNQNAPVGATPGNSVSGYSIDPTSGALRSIGSFPAGPNPTWISFRPDGRFAYVSNSNSGNVGSISVYSVGSTGALTAVGSPVTVENGPADLTIDASGTHLYVPNQGSGTISVFSIDPTAGTLTQVGTSVASGPGPRLVVIEPTGKFAYVSSSSGADVWGYSINPTTGALTPVTGNPFPSGSGTSNPSFITIDPSGQFAYSANTAGGTVSGWTINPSTGTLTSIGTVPAGGLPFVVSISPELPGIRD
jgi:6-phosphogluconolactonase (cycloisomerase 2 family)